MVFSGPINQGNWPVGVQIPVQSYQECQKTSLFLDVRFVNQKHRNIIADGVNAMAGAAFQLVLLLVVRQRSFAGWTGEDFEQIATDHGPILIPLVSCVWNLQTSFSLTESAT